MKTSKKIFFILFLLITNLSCSYPQKKELLAGADVLLKDHLDLLKGKRIGIVTNHTAVLKNGTHLVDAINNYKETKITALFGPEHGIRGISSAGEEVKNDIDVKTGIHIFSLYGKSKKPTKEMLENVDLILYDIQDIGVRFYTYISTLFYVLQSAAENNIPVIVLDRPDPIDGITIEGPVLEEELKSFVGIVQIPVRYGMTAGELANFYNEEGLLGKNIKADLTVMKLQNWERKNYFSDFSLPWIPPSPNIPTFESALVYPGTCLLEGTNVSEGRGTKNPFITIGAPYINSFELMKELKNYSIAGARIDSISFIPVNIEGAAKNPKYENETCYGISIYILEKEKFKGFDFGIKLLASLIKLYPESFKFNSYFDKLSGNSTLREYLLQNKPVEEIISSWQKEIEDFKSIRKNYLLY